MKKEKNLGLDSEIKSYDMTEEEKIKIFNKIQDIETFHGCVKVFDKKYMKKEIVDSNIFFNYAVKVLIQDCILPELNLQENDEPIEFIISIDNRNIRVGELNNLETYLKTEFCIYDDDFKITYCHISPNFLVSEGDFVSQGQIIANVGPKYVYGVPGNKYTDSNGRPTNGATTGTHLHLGMRINDKYVNPLNYF